MTEIGNGGAGPYYGVLPFGKDDDDRDWEGGGLVGDLSKPFPHVTAWNLPVSFWDEEPNPPPGTPLGAEDELWEVWDGSTGRTILEPGNHERGDPHLP